LYDVIMWTRGMVPSLAGAPPARATAEAGRSSRAIKTILVNARLEGHLADACWRGPARPVPITCPFGDESAR